MREPNDVTPCDAAEVTRWDDTADVIVVGFGAAGSAAAFSAAAAGAQVLVTERTGGPGGAAALAEGIVYLGGGTPIQKACGFEDSLDDMYRYMMAACGPDPDEAKIARYCEESLGHFDWLVARGVPFDPTFCADTSMAPDGTEGLVYSGGEDAYPFNEIARPAPAGAPGQDEALDGMAPHAAPGGCRHRGGRGRLDRHPGRPPGVDDGRVVGVQAQRFGETVTLRARRGVVLTAGGFIFNDDMLRQHCPPLARGTFKVGTEGDDGRGIRMAQAIGASVRNMYAGEVSLPITPPRTLIHGILVNGQGQRFINEDTYMGRVGQSALYEQDGEVYLDRRRGLLRGELDGPRRHAGSARPRRSSSPRSACPPVRSRRPWSSTTGTRRRGRTRSSTRPPSWVRPLVPPIGAVDLRIGPAPYAPFTLGGLETTVAGEVLRPDRRRHRGAVRRRAHHGRACARSATPAGSPSGTARCSAASPARARLPRLRDVRPAAPSSTSACAGRSGYEEVDIERRIAMDLDLLDLYGRASDWTVDQGGRAPRRSWMTPTSCDGWDVRTLMNHMLQTQRYFVGAARGEDVAPPAGTPPDVRQRRPDAPTSTTPRRDVADLRRARGDREDRSCARHRVQRPAAARLGSRHVDRAGHDMPDGCPRSPTPSSTARFTDEQRKGVFKPEIAVAPNASAQDKLLAYTGRDPSRRASA